MAFAVLRGEKQRGQGSAAETQVGRRQRFSRFHQICLTRVIQSPLYFYPVAPRVQNLRRRRPWNFNFNSYRYVISTIFYSTATRRTIDEQIEKESRRNSRHRRITETDVISFCRKRGIIPSNLAHVEIEKRVV